MSGSLKVHEYRSAKETRAYLRHLRRQGVPQSMISELTGLSERHIWQLRSGRIKRVRPSTEDLILGIALSDTRGLTRGKISSQDSRRRVEEMRQAGFSMGWICRQLGRRNSNQLEFRSTILAARAEAIRELHDRLWRENAIGCDRRGRKTGQPFRRVCKCIEWRAIEPESELRRRQRARSSAA